MEIKDLPNEILILIYSYLDLRSIYELSNTCFLFKNLYKCMINQPLYNYNEKEWITFISYVKNQINYEILKVQNNKKSNRININLKKDEELFVIVSEDIKIINFINKEEEVKTFNKLYKLIKYIDLFKFNVIVFFTYKINRKLNYIKLYKTKSNQTLKFCT